MVLFNPTLNTIEKETTVRNGYECHRDFFKVNKTLIAFVYSTFDFEKIVIMNTSLEVLHEKKLTLHKSQLFGSSFVGADDSYVYTLSENKHKVNVLDWSLTNVSVLDFQSSNSTNGFYLDQGETIEKISKKDSKCFVFLDDNKINIYDDNDGTLLKCIQKRYVRFIFPYPQNWPKFDKSIQHFLFINREKQLFSYDLCGNPVKCVHMMDKSRKIVDYGIDQHDQIYAYDSNFLYSIC